jgi:hypothetical protein
MNDTLHDKDEIDRKGKKNEQKKCENVQAIISLKGKAADNNSALSSEKVLLEKILTDKQI